MPEVKTDATYEQVLHQPCSTCGAKAEEACPRRSIPRYVHYARWDRYLKSIAGDSYPIARTRPAGVGRSGKRYLRS